MSDLSGDLLHPSAPTDATVDGSPSLAGALPDESVRPSVTVGAALLLLGGALLIIGSLLDWYTQFGRDVNGFSTVDGETRNGPVFVFFGVVAAGFGVAMLAAKRMLAVAILGVVFSALAVLVAFIDLADVADAKDEAPLLGLELTQGPGLWVILVGGLVALAGGIAALAKRRR